MFLFHACTPCVCQVFLNMTTANMITMEYVPGIKINNIEKIEQAGIDRGFFRKL